MSKYYRLLLDDYAAPSFTSFDKDYYGTLDQLHGFFNAINDFIGKWDYNTCLLLWCSIYKCWRNASRKLNRLYFIFNEHINGYYDVIDDYYNVTESSSGNRTCTSSD